MKSMLKKSTTTERKWQRWISGGALLLTLAGQFVPATAHAVIDIGEEVIEIEGTAPDSPWTPTNLDGHTGEGAPNGTPGGDSGGSGGGGSGGGGSVPSAGGSQPKPTEAQKRLSAEKEACKIFEGIWSTAVFNDYDTNVAFAGYSCTYKLTNNKTRTLYYDSEGWLNQTCTKEGDIVICEPPAD